MSSNDPARPPPWLSTSAGTGMSFAQAAAQTALSSGAGRYVPPGRRQSLNAGGLPPPTSRPQPTVPVRQNMGRFPALRPQKTCNELTDDLRSKLGELSKPSGNHWDQYIFPGVIIRTRHIEEKISGITDPTNVSFKDQKGRTISVTPKERLFIIVRTQDEQCFTAVPLFTYDGKGLEFYSDSKKACYISIEDIKNPATRNVEPPAANITGNGRLQVKHFVSGSYIHPMSVVFFTYPVSFLYKKTISIWGCLDESSRDVLLKLFYRFLSPEIAQLEKWQSDTQEKYNKLEDTRRGWTSYERDDMERENAHLKAEVERLRDALNSSTDIELQGSPSKRPRSD